MSDAEKIPEGPRQFLDLRGRKWLVEVSDGTRRRLIRDAGIDIADLLAQDCQLLQRLSHDYDLLGRALFVVLEPQIKERGLDETAFAEGLGGAVLWEAQQMLLWGIVDFFPDPRVRAMLRGALEKIVAVADVIMSTRTSEVVDALAAVDPNIVAASLTSERRSSPESSASTRVPTRSGRSRKCAKVGRVGRKR